MQRATSSGVVRRLLRIAQARDFHQLLVAGDQAQRGRVGDSGQDRVGGDAGGREFQRQLPDVGFEDRPWPRSPAPYSGMARVLPELVMAKMRAPLSNSPAQQAFLHPVDQRVAHDVGGGFDLLLVGDRLARPPAA